MIARNPRYPLPDEMETLLLQASLLEGEAAFAAYSSWRKTVSIDALDYGSHRALPLLWKNLQVLGVNDLLMGRLRGVARYAWLFNQTLIAALASPLNTFKQANIPAVLLKGMAFVTSLPNQEALRAMDDADLLVRPSDVAAAVDLLAASGWTPHYSGTTEFIKREVVWRQASYGFQGRGPRQLDLHWFLLDQNRWPSADAALWSRVMPVRIGAEHCYAPSFEDQVLHACVHGATWSGSGRLRWAADSTIILRARCATFDWSYLLDQCRQRRVIVPIRNCLEYLSRFLEVPVPAVVLAELRREPVSFSEVADYRCRATISPAERLTARAAWFLDFQDFRATSKTLTHALAVTAFFAWLKERWAVDSAGLAFVLTVFAKLRQPSWLRIVIQGIWRRDWRAVNLRQRKLAKISQGPFNLSIENHQSTLLYGWHDPEPGGRWTRSREAAMAFDVGTCLSDLRITVSVFGILTESHPSLRVDIWANRRRLPSWRLELQHSRMHNRVIEVPKSALRDQFLVLTFVIRHPRSPTSLGLSEDNRSLGLFVQSLSFAPLTNEAVRDEWRLCTTVARPP
jgi:Uncharacterised nucleotidyltransferase